MSVLPLRKPEAFSFDSFRSTKPPTAGGSVETLQPPLPHHSISAAKDFVRLHPDDDYWSPELCFVSVPIKGQKNGSVLHLINEELAKEHLMPASIRRMRLALATKPFGELFLCHIPSRNLDNAFNKSALEACYVARTCWVQVSSLKSEGVDGYMMKRAVDDEAFGAPKWTSQALLPLVGTSFDGAWIQEKSSPALARLIGAKPSFE